MLHDSKEGLGKRGAIFGLDMVEKWGPFSNWISQKSFFRKLKEKSQTRDVIGNNAAIT